MSAAEGTQVGADWINGVRQTAQQKVDNLELPTARDEYWKYTNPRPYLSADGLQTLKLDQAALWKISQDTAQISISNGVVSLDSASIDAGTIDTLATASQDPNHWAKNLLGTMDDNSHCKLSHVFADVNGATAQDGVVIHATGENAKPVLVSALGGQGAQLRHVIRVEPGATCTVVETGDYGDGSTVVLEIDVAEGGRFNHVRLSDTNAQSASLSYVFGRVAKSSEFKSFTMTLDGGFTRNEIILDILGDDAVAHVAGAAIGSADFHHDDTVFITHDAVNCESRQVYKKVLSEGAVGVFQGKILVQPDAQKTDGYQISQSLLLDDKSQFLAKPELEIYADDVACSHGSTSGAIDETALFYLRSRGVPESKARDLLIISFLAEAIEEIEDEDIAQSVLDHLTNWLERRSA